VAARERILKYNAITRFILELSLTAGRCAFRHAAHRWDRLLVPSGGNVPWFSSCNCLFKALQPQNHGNDTKNRAQSLKKTGAALTSGGKPWQLRPPPVAPGTIASTTSTYGRLEGRRQLTRMLEAFGVRSRPA
jgi:hypothetical protein